MSSLRRLATLALLPLSEAVQKLVGAMPAAGTMPAAGQLKGGQSHKSRPKAPTSRPEGWGFDLTGRDDTASAGSDFFQFANGGYLAAAKTPDGRPMWGPGDELTEAALSKVRDILETDSGKLGDFYRSYMDDQTITRKGLKPLEPLLNEIRAVRDVADFCEMASKSGSTLLPSPFQLIIDVDPKNPSTYSLGLRAGGLGLPSRNLYFSPSNKELRKEYQNYVQKVLKLMEWPDFQQVSHDVIALEENFAESQEASLDPSKTYNPKTQSELEQDAPGFDWGLFFEGAGLKMKDDDVIVESPGAVTKMAKIIGNTNVSVLKAWSVLHMFGGVANYLPKSYSKVHFDFYGRIIAGQEDDSPRWKTGVRILNRHMGGAVGFQFILKYFPIEKKNMVESLVKQVKAAFEERLDNSTWMTSTTKKKALTKLKELDIQVGYSKQLESYEKLEVKDDDLFGNIGSSLSRLWSLQLSRLGRPVDREEWSVTAQEVKAYSNLQLNQIVVTAATLQPPFFDLEADMAVNFGAIGAMIGHEMTHGFDSIGRYYDEKGKLNNWWSPEDEKEYYARAAEYGRQFSSFDLGGSLNGSQINADRTIVENIADLGGLAVAMDAYHATRNSTMSLFEKKEGDRRFFYGWAQVWRTSASPEAMENMLASDPRAPSVARVNVPTRNMDAWYEAFGVSEMSQGYLKPSKRITIF